MKKTFITTVILLIISIILAGAPAATAITRHDSGFIHTDPKAIISEKDETVYVNLENDGSISDINVVNHFITHGKGKYRDYGNYTDIKNLTNIVQPLVENNSITWALDGNDKNFFYQGKMSKGELPWRLTIKYFLDGREIEPPSLAGQSGRLSITLHAEINPKAEDYFIDNYMMQISLPVDLTRCSNIHAPEASKVIVGQKAILAFTVLPGSSSEFGITMDTQAFEMDSIEITITAANLSSYIQTEDLTGGLQEMSQGMQEIIDGTTALKDGIEKLSKGIGDLNRGAGSLSGSIPEIWEGMNEYDSGLDKLNNSVTQLASASQDIGYGIEGLASAGPMIAYGYKDIENALVAMLPSQDMKASLEAMAQNAGSHDPLLAQMGQLAQAMLKQLDGIAELHKGLSALNANLGTYVGNIDTLSQQYKLFNEGIQRLPEAAGGMAAGFKEIKAGNRRFYQAVNELAKGIDRLDSQTGRIPQEIGLMVDGQQEMHRGMESMLDEIKSITGVKGETQEKPVSFAAPGLIKPKSVQFLLRTPPITILEQLPHDSKTAEDTKKADILEKLVNLFK